MLFIAHDKIIQYILKAYHQSSQTKSKKNEKLDFLLKDYKRERNINNNPINNRT